MVTGIATAMMDSSPIVCITGQVGSNVIGSDAFQETDITGITLPITKHNYLVTRAEDDRPEPARSISDRGFRPPRPGAGGHHQRRAERAPANSIGKLRRRERTATRPVFAPDRKEFDEALALINSARSARSFSRATASFFPALEAKYTTFAEKAGIPVALTLLGLGAFPASHPLSLGMMGMHGEAWVNEAIQEADLLIALGMRFDDRVTGNLKTYAPKAKKIHVEIDRAEINKNVRVDVPLIGDLREILQHLLPGVKHDGSRANGVDQIAASKQDSAVRDIQNLPDNGHLYAAHVINALWRETKGEAIVVTDVGQHQMWEAQYYHHEQPRTLITSGGLGTMGFALPAAIGAKFARPDAEVWVIAGDGGFQMTMCELATIVQEKIEREDRHHQQRLPGNGAPVAGVLLRRPLRVHAAAQPGFRKARGRLRHPGLHRRSARSGDSGA